MIDDPLKPVFGATGVMTTATANKPTLPDAPVPPPPDPYAGLGIIEPAVTAPVAPVPQDPYAGLGIIEPQTAPVKDPYEGLGIIPDVVPAPIAPPVVQAPPDSFFGDVKLAGKVIGTGLYSAIADVLPKTLAETWIGGNLKVSDAMSVVAQYRNQQIEDLKRFDLTPAEEENALFGIIKAKNVLAGLQNLGYSAATAIAGMLGGAKIGAMVGGAIGAPTGPGAVATGGLGATIGGVLGAGLMTAPVAYRATKTQIVSDMRDKLLQANPDMTEEQWQVARKLFENEARKYAAWEAGPEIIGNMVTAGIIKTPAGAWIKQIPLIKNAIARTAASAGVKLGLDIPVEVGTEVVTQMGQEAVQYRLGLQENPPTWLGAFKAVTPQTLVTTIATLGLGSVANQISKPIAAKLQAPAKTSADIRADFVKLGIPEAIIDQSGVADKLVAAKTDAEYSKALNDFAAENIKETVAPVAPIVAPTAAQADQVQPPAPVVLPPVTAEEIARKPPDTGVPPLKQVEKPAVAPVVPPKAPAPTDVTPLVPPPAPITEQSADRAGLRATEKTEAAGEALPSEAKPPPAEPPVAGRAEAKQFPAKPENASQFTRRPLSDYSPVMYRQMSQRELEQILSRDQGVENRTLMVSNDPSLALSQTSKANVIVEFDSKGLTGTPNTNKPAWPVLYDQNIAEFFANGLIILNP
jgi:hypothetical protein